MEKSKKVFYGWIVVAGGFVLMAVLHSMLQTCFSLFVVPVTTDMQISRSAFGICNTVIMVVTMLLSPYMGRWLAGKNTRGIFTGCVVGLGLSYASYSLAQATWHFYVSAALVGIFSCGAIVLPLSIIITNWFHKARGTAISIALAGSGIGGAIISPILTHFIQTDGWRSSFVIFGIVMRKPHIRPLVWLVLAVPITLVLAGLGYFYANSSSDLSKNKYVFYDKALTAYIGAYAPYAFMDKGGTLDGYVMDLTYAVSRVMLKSGGNQSVAARLLGISQPAISKRLNS
jgi:Sugar phosphate permease